MVAKKRAKKKVQSWDQIGKSIGKKMDKTDWKKMCNTNDCHKESGAFGRLIFAIALMYILNISGYLTNVSMWAQAALVIGFWWMKI